MIRLFYIILILILSSKTFGQVNQLITTYQGLSNNSITYIFKDSEGFVWIGTIDGLNRYDGNSFVVYKQDPTNKNSISDNFISSITEDYRGNLWIGTQGSGLNRYDPVHEKFEAFYSQEENANSLPSNYIYHHQSLLIQNDSILWIATDNGLCYLNINSLIFTRIEINSSEKVSNDIRTIFLDNKDQLWIGTISGLYNIDKTGNILNEYTFNAPPKLSNNIITALADNKTGEELWIGTEYGLNILYKKTNTIKQLIQNKKSNNTLSDNSITSIQKDEIGNMWIGTKSGGLNKFDLKSGNFTSFKQSTSGSNRISDNYIDYVYYDNDGLLWLGTINAGINVIDIDKKKFSLFRKNPGKANSLSHNTIRSVFEDSDKQIWIGTYGGGISLYNGKSFKNYQYEPDNPFSISHNIVSAFCEDKQGQIWVGTWGGGLNIINKTTQKILNLDQIPAEYIHELRVDVEDNIWIGSNSGIYIYNYQSNQLTNASFNNKLTSKSVNDFYFDNSDRLWVATWNGLNIVYLKEDSFVADSIVFLKKDPGSESSISENRTTTICEDSDNNIWVGTYGGGINKIEMNGESIKIMYYNNQNGLAGNIVYGILEDEHKNLWISTNNGLSKLSIADERFHNFDINDGLQDNQFYWNAYAKCKSGEMYFGGINGLNYFHPDSITYSEDFPQVLITNFLLFNKSVKVGEENNILSEAIFKTEKIELKRKDYAFTLEFGATVFKSQSKISYAYKLENFDPEWITTDYKKRFASYSHLRPGTYTFKVKSTNADGTWNNKYTSLDIKILPAYYETIWAFIIYGILLLVLLINFRYQILSRARYKHDIQLAKMEKQNTEAYNDMKLQFFTNVSHEFKTPLTLILGPLENILNRNDLDKALSTQLHLMKSGSKRLYRLVNQLMEFRKVETGNYNLNIQHNNISEVIQETSFGFNAKANQNSIDYIVSIDHIDINVWFDINIIETIIYNLLSNAFKYTPDNGQINLMVYFENEYAEKISDKNHSAHYINIEVADTGKGIEKTRVENIFKRFYQAERFSDQKRGTGIGLALTKDLVEAHHGNIQIKSEVGSGTKFIIKIPIHETYFNPEEINTEGIKSAVSESILDNNTIETNTNNAEETIQGKPKKKNAAEILIVEDDIELIGYINKILSQKYRTRVANNGAQGLEMALKEEPDLILSDIMMPQMSGLELCETVKSDVRLSHIPIILITALSSNDDQVSGYNKGADAYISKPFNQDILLAQINNLIEQRKKLQLNFQERYQVETKKEESLTADEKFLNKVLKYIQNNIAEENLNVENLGNEIGISTTHLYRKIKSLTGLSTNELIRKTRLKMAAKRLSLNQGSISEVMYSVGFNNSSYFAKCFQEEFGVLPKDYLKK